MSVSPLKLPKVEDSHKDVYCFECHRGDDGDVINCVTCPRAYHPSCLRLTAIPERDWTCPECEVTQSSFDIINPSISLQSPSRNEFQVMLKYALHRLKAYPQVDINNVLQTPNPMDLTTIENNLQRKKYSSTEAFLGDIKWILHNCIVNHGNHSKQTHTARTLLRTARQEMTEIEICSECYLRGAQAISADWFTKPCTVPHTLCWAKTRNYQAWPAKVLRVTNDEVDVRFFGEHDRAWVSMDDCFVLSKEYPDVQKRKTNLSLKKSLDELQSHIDQLKKLYGHFTYAPPHTLLSKTKAFKFVSIIDDSILPYYMTVSNRLHSSQKHDHEQAIKRMRMSTDENQFQSNLNVFDILDQAERPTDNQLRIQALLRKYTDCHSSAIDNVFSKASNNQISEQPLKRKKPRKSSSQHRVIQQTSLPFVPLRPLSVSPPRVDTFESLPCATNEMIPTQSSETNVSLPTIIPNSNHLQATINSFNDQFQELLVNFTDQIQQSLETTRMKYEQNLEEIRRSYRTSLNDFHSITTEQIHEIHNDLEAQYLQRLSELRRRYESKLQYH